MKIIYQWVYGAILLNRTHKMNCSQIEGGMIDQAHHRGTAKRALDETVALATAVEDTLKLVDTKDTLLIVTADHTHTLAISGYPDRGSNILGRKEHKQTEK
jgi:alkaline phosphatase